MNEKGFTLVEVMVVIMIIASISVLAVNTFVQQRNRSAVLFAADEFLTEINFLQSKIALNTASGSRFDEISDELEKGDGYMDKVNDKQVCYQFELQDNGESFKVYEMPYSLDKIFKNGKWQFGGCQEAAKEEYKVIAYDAVKFTVEGGEKFTLSAPRGEIESEMRDITLQSISERDQVTLEFNNETNKFVIESNE